MYETSVGLKKRPFAAVPLVEGYFPGTAAENARLALTRCIERGEGFGMVVGPVGTGKTLLCQKLAEQFKNTFRVVLLASGRLSTRRSLFQAILYELGQPYRGMDEGELRLALVDYLMLGKDQSRGLLLLVDEAHTLPLRLLDELRMLTNLARAGQPLIRLVLAGSGALEERLASPKLDSFNSRIAARCYLEAFNRSETAEYLRAKVALAGGNGGEIFSDGACQSVFQATEGVPRLINQLCDHALLVAFSLGRKRLEAADIEEAWADLQQLPTPWNGDGQSDKPGVIEFGRLDDMPVEESAESIKMPTPPLKINAEMDDFDLDLAEPVEQIETIKQMIAGTEQDFEPTEPEIELSFEEFEHPFLEKFEHEEVVNDRYAAPAPAFSTLQSVAQVYQPELLAESTVIPAKAVEEMTEPLSWRQETAVATLEPENSPVLIIREEDSTEVEEPVAKKKLLQPVKPARRNDYSRLFATLRRD
jgi:type II secretory pathway predicted ATPase ExeA